MRYKSGEMREQVILLPESIDEYVAEDNIVRVIDAFVDRLDIEGMGFKYSNTKQTGCMPYNPADILKLYVYGYLNGIRSSRKLEKEARRNIEVMWLLRKLIPDDKTIANFRKDNNDKMKAVFKEFILICKGLKLLGKETIGIDGSKFKAVNARKRLYTKDNVNKSIKAIEEKITAYMEEMDKNDKIEEQEETLTKEEIQEKIKFLRERSEKLQEIREELDKNGIGQIAKTDPDSRLMKSKGTYEVCYNVQTVVDSENKLIVDYEVTNEACDTSQLEPMSKRAKEILEADKLEVLADKGYYDGEQIKGCIEAGITPYIAKKESRPEGIEFKYEKGTDTYICTNGKKLTYKDNFKAKGKLVRRYECRECEGCQYRDMCTDSKTGRTIRVWEHQDILDNMDRRVKKHYSKYRQRMGICEHPFGTIKRAMNCGYLLVKGMQNVASEMGLIMLSFNLKRVVNIVGVRELVQILKQKVFAYV